MKIKIKMNRNGNKTLSIPQALRAVPTNREGLFETHRLPIGIYALHTLPESVQREVETLLPRMRKAIYYAYPTSQIAKDLKFKTGVYYVAKSVKYADVTPNIVCGAEKLSDCQRMAETLPEDYHVFCGVKQDGNNFK